MILNSRGTTSAVLPSVTPNWAPESSLSLSSGVSALASLDLRGAPASSSTKRLYNLSGFFVDVAGHLGVPLIWRFFSASQRCCFGTLFIVLPFCTSLRRHLLFCFDNNMLAGSSYLSNSYSFNTSWCQCSLLFLNPTLLLPSQCQLCQNNLLNFYNFILVSAR